MCQLLFVEKVEKSIEAMSLPNVKVTSEHQERVAMLQINNEQAQILIEYTEYPENMPYSFYDVNLIVRIKGGSYLYAMSEQPKERIDEDVREALLIVEHVLKSDYTFIDEQFLIFWCKKYMRIEDSGGELFLLKTR